MAKKGLFFSRGLPQSDTTSAPNSHFRLEKVTFGSLSGQKLTFGVTSRVTLGETPKAIFQSLFGYFDNFVCTFGGVFRQIECQSRNSDSPTLGRREGASLAKLVNSVCAVCPRRKKRPSSNRDGFRFSLTVPPCLAFSVAFQLHVSSATNLSNASDLVRFLPRMGESCFSNRTLVKAVFEAFKWLDKKCFRSLRISLD